MPDAARSMAFYRAGLATCGHGNGQTYNRIISARRIVAAGGETDSELPMRLCELTRTRT
jgi:hypothetical protein